MEDCSLVSFQLWCDLIYQINPVCLWVMISQQYPEWKTVLFSKILFFTLLMRLVPYQHCIWLRARDVYCDQDRLMDWIQMDVLRQDYFPLATVPPKVIFLQSVSLRLSWNFQAVLNEWGANVVKTILERVNRLSFLFTLIQIIWCSEAWFLSVIKIWVLSISYKVWAGRDCSSM